MKLSEMSFDDMVKFCAGRTLDKILDDGFNLKSIVWDVCNIAVQWNQDKNRFQCSNQIKFSKKLLKVLASGRHDVAEVVRLESEAKQLGILE